MEAADESEAAHLAGGGQEAGQEGDSGTASARAQNRKGGWLILGAVAVILLLCVLNVLYSHFAEFRYFRPGIRDFDARRYPAAEAEFRTYLHWVNDADGHYFLGQTLLAEGQISAARAEFLRDVAVRPGNQTGRRSALSARSAAILRGLH